MSAAWGKPEIKLHAASGRVEVRCELRNDSSETWRAAEGMAVSYHLFDAESGTVIEDGPRYPLTHDVPPGAAIASPSWWP